MKCNWKALATEVIATLSQEEWEKSIVYIEQRVIQPGEVLPWSGIPQSFDKPVVIAFIDLEPELNWTHRGRYIVLEVSSGIRLSVDVDRPPFLTEVSPYLRLIHRGGQAPGWAVVTSLMAP